MYKLEKDKEWRKGSQNWRVSIFLVLYSLMKLSKERRSRGSGEEKVFDQACLIEGKKLWVRELINIIL